MVSGMEDLLVFLISVSKLTNIAYKEDEQQQKSTVHKYQIMEC